MLEPDRVDNGCRASVTVQKISGDVQLSKGAPVKKQGRRAASHGCTYLYAVVNMNKRRLCVIRSELVHEIYSEEVHAMLQQALFDHSRKRNPKTGLELLPLSHATIPGEQPLCTTQEYGTKYFTDTFLDTYQPGSPVYDPPPQVLQEVRDLHCEGPKPLHLSMNCSRICYGQH